MLSAGTLVLLLSISGCAGFLFRAGEHQNEAQNYNYTKYHSMAEISSWMNQTVTENPGVVTSEVYGKTFEDRDITLLKVNMQDDAHSMINKVRMNDKHVGGSFVFAKLMASHVGTQMKTGWMNDNWDKMSLKKATITELYNVKISIPHPEGKEKKGIWMDCGIHAREWIAPAFCQWFVKEILQTSKTDEKMKELVQNLDFYVTPVLNVDGYVYTWLNESTRLWRKNRSTANGCSCLGVDLNRNFNANWGTVGVSTDCCSSTYGGSSAVSEKEAQAVTLFVGNKTKEIICFLTIHSYGQQVLFPYGHPHITAPNYNELMEAGMGAAKVIKTVHGMEYEAGAAVNILYEMSGSSQDWARLIGIPFSYTFELRDKKEFGFLLPEEQIQPTCEEAFAGARHIITYAHDKTFGDGTDSGAVSRISSFWVTVLTSYLSINIIV